MFNISDARALVTPGIWPLLEGLAMTNETVTDDNGVEQEVISRAEAKARGLKRYFTGKPCKHGHNAERFTCNNQCSTCKLEYYNANIQKTAENQKNYRIKNLESLKEKKQIYYKECKERINEKSKRYYQKNKEKIKSDAAKWRKNNPEKARISSSNKKARKRNADGFYSDRDIRRIYEDQRGRCSWCGCNVKFGDHHVDHIQPLSKGGSNWPSNLCVACPDCNMQKRAKDPIDWAQSLGFLI